MKKSVIVLIIGMILATPLSICAKNDSTRMARKAERQEEKERQKRIDKLERQAEPRFRGGSIEKFEAWVVANLRYDFGELPRTTPHVRVEVPFYVEEDGTTSLCDEDMPSRQLYPRLVSEIERVILFSPEWEPGHGPLGNPIRSRQVLSITLQNHHYVGAQGAAAPAMRRGRR